MTEAIPVGRRPRLLFIDDQREVARTLAKLLNPMPVECRFADDGEAGLRRLQSEVFDLVIVDLRMPPAEWGGLWLLEKLAEHQITANAIVLSGEAGQAETIKAMRLGAFDFVVKDNAQAELCDRVKEALGEAARLRWQFAATDLPSPLSIPITRMALRSDEIHKLRAAVSCVEAVYRFAALAACAACGRPGRSLLVDSLAGPSMGTWQHLCRRLLDDLPSSALRRWLEFIVGTTANEITTLRNDLHHGADPTQRWAQEHLPLVGDWLDQFLALARYWPHVSLIVPGALEYKDGRFLVDAATISGNASAVGSVRLSRDQPVETGHVHLLTEGSLVDMWPLVTAERGEMPGRWNVFVLDSYRNSGSRAETATGKLRYLDLERGERTTSRATVVEDIRYRAD
ncbi:response regulator [Micromonospora chaiyaphumensis]|uniref:Response regulator receiver domain-containing protein n=1 Tax=Micromonospora chaiyaphumensis TaxID=307119 RepID=A0A1C4W7S5_9ACTN|nr:response regulator [Micromonospora chaiyaphumensis]SCE92260.1 Response regulator receiver domain-containing protein [Micromonospora chaiyaphumensis]